MKQKSEENGRCTAECSDRTLEQLEKCAGFRGSRGQIYIDSNIVQDLFEDARLQHLCKKAKRSSAKIFLAMPHIFRADAVRKFELFIMSGFEIARGRCID